MVSQYDESLHLARLITVRMCSTCLMSDEAGLPSVAKRQLLRPDLFLPFNSHVPFRRDPVRLILIIQNIFIKTNITIYKTYILRCNTCAGYLCGKSEIEIVRVVT
jgi:hypothetical protein